MPFVINRWYSGTTSWDVNVPDSGAPAGPIPFVKGLPIKRPNSRSIDARTITDSYNRGQPIEPDYTWPGGRKFYQ